jgi:recombination protein RecA
VSIEDVMAKLSKKTRARMQAASEITIEKLPLASVGLTRDLGGGFARGRVATVWGAKSAAKTSLLLQTAGQLQKQGLTAAFVDAEHTYDPTWAANMGVDNSQMIVSESNSVDAMTTDVIELCQAKVDFIIVDSVSGLIPSSYYEKDSGGELKEGLEGSKQIGTLSKELSNALMKINAVNDCSVVVFISQTRNKITTWGAMGQAQGGNALMYFSSVVVKVTSSASDKEQIKGEKTFGDKIVEVPIGRKVEYTIQYSKTSPPGLAGDYKFYYEGDHLGIDEAGEIIDLALKNGIMRQSGAWCYYGEEKFNGRLAASTWIRENGVAREELWSKLVQA